MVENETVPSVTSFVIDQGDLGPERCAVVLQRTWPFDTDTVGHQANVTGRVRRPAACLSGGISSGQKTDITINAPTIGVDACVIVA